jgi:hypothetical protein
MFPDYEFLHLPIVVLAVARLAWVILRKPSWTGSLVPLLAMFLGESLVSPDHDWLLVPSLVALAVMAALNVTRVLWQRHAARLRPAVGVQVVAQK